MSYWIQPYQYFLAQPTKKASYRDFSKNLENRITFERIEILTCLSALSLHPFAFQQKFFLKSDDANQSNQPTSQNPIKMDNFHKNCPIWLKFGMQVSYCPCPPLPLTITAPAHHYRPCPPILSLTPILFRFFKKMVSVPLCPILFIAKFRSNRILKMNIKCHELIKRRLFFDFMMKKIWSDSNSATQRKVCGTGPNFFSKLCCCSLCCNCSIWCRWMISAVWEANIQGCIHVM